MKKFQKRLVILLLSISTVFIIWKLGVFNINKINVTISNVVCANEEDIEKVTGLSGKNILFTDSVKIKENLQNQFPCIKEVELKKSFPNTVNLNIAGRNVFARLVSFNSVSLSLKNLEATPSSTAALLDWSKPNLSSLAFLADEEGVIFKEGEESSLPFVLLPEPELKIGQKLDGELFAKLAQIFNKLRELNFGTLQTGNLNDVALSAKVVDGAVLIHDEEKVVLSLQKDLLRQLASLQLILEKAKIDGDVIEMIDLRFDKPVVVYTK